LNIVISRSVQLTSFFYLLLSGIAINQAAESGQPSTEQSQASSQQPPPNHPLTDNGWNNTLASLRISNTADEALDLSIGEIPGIMLKRRAQTQNLRGNLVILHTAGENPDHIRLVQPLSQQLSQLGWQVWIPAIPRADYPVDENEITTLTSDLAHKEIAQASSAVEPNNAPPVNPDSTSQTEPTDSENSTQRPDVAPQQKVLFENTDAYQKFFQELLSQVLEQIDGQEKPLVVLGNQDSAYWLLESLKQNPPATQIVLLFPTVPIAVEKNLPTTFENQKAPVFMIRDNSDASDAYSNTFEQALRSGKTIQISQGIYNSEQIYPEDESIARAITGWVKKQIGHN